MTLGNPRSVRKTIADVTSTDRLRILEVAFATIAEPGSNASGLWCIPIRP
jgi:hypothetical protein